MSSPPIVDFAPTDAARFGPKLVALTALSRLGAPIPPFFALDAETCALARQSAQLPIAVKQAITEAMGKLEKKAERRFGDAHAPLLVSVRASSRTRMPAMLSKVLDVGLTSHTMAGLVSGGRTRRFALDCQLHLLRTYGEAYMARPQGAQTSPFSAACAEARRRFGATTTGELDTPVLEELVATYHALYARDGVALPPDDPWEQLWAAIGAVSRSWSSPTATAFRREQQIPERPGPALAITAMVFGNADARSASGVALSRHAISGARGPTGEYLPTAQGDERVAGHGRPLALAQADAVAPEERALSLENKLPEAFAALSRELARVERQLGAPAEIEFAVEEGRLWLLHAQVASLSTRAQLRATVELAAEGIISEASAVKGVKPAELAAVMQASTEPTGEATVFAKGLPASPGACTGRLTLSANDVHLRAGRGEAVIFVCSDTTPADGPAVRLVKGLVTTRGGTTSDAAIMARALGRPCIVSARELILDPVRRTITARDHTVKDGDTITIDGTRGELLLGRRGAVAAPSLDEAARLLSWADAARAIDVRALVESADEVKEAQAAGAHGFLVHRLARWVRGDLTELFAAAGAKPITLRLPTSADPDMDVVRLNALVEASPGPGLELLVDGLGWNLHPRLLKLRARLREAGLDRARVGVWIDTDVDLKSLVGPASPLGAVDRVVVELSTMARRSLLPRAASSATPVPTDARSSSSTLPPITAASFATGSVNDSGRRVDPSSPAARVLPVMEAVKALGAQAPQVGVIAPLSSGDPDVAPYAQAKLAFVGVSTRDLPLVRLAAGRAGVP